MKTKLIPLTTALLVSSATAQAVAQQGIPGNWVGIGLGIIGSILAFGLVRLNTLASAKIGTIKNEGFQKLLGNVWTLASAKVAQLMQDVINNIKTASSDGTLTADEARTALLVAVGEIWQALPPAQQKEAMEAAAQTEDKTDAQKTARAKELIIAPQVEKAVQEQKKGGLVATLSIPGASLLPDSSATVSEMERIARGQRAADARRALQERLSRVAVPSS